jgi:integrase
VRYHRAVRCTAPGERSHARPRTRRSRLLRHRLLLQWGRFIRERRAGTLSGGKAVGDRTIEYDLRLLSAVLNWAVDAKIISTNPCAGFVTPHEDAPQQPILSRKEYDALQTVAMRVSPRFALALTLAWETGRRISALRHLRWADADLENATLMFRKKFDKSRRKGARDTLVAISASAAAALSAARDERSRAGLQIGDGWVFPSGRRDDAPLGKRYFQRWWHKAEERAGIAHEHGRAWHACRRAWTTDLFGNRVSDEVVNSLGGWARGSSVARSVYQQPQLEHQRAAINLRTG